jgi:hypothetical protein
VLVAEGIRDAAEQSALGAAPVLVELRGPVGRSLPSSSATAAVVAAVTAAGTLLVVTAAVRLRGQNDDVSFFLPRGGGSFRGGPVEGSMRTEENGKGKLWVSVFCVCSCSLFFSLFRVPPVAAPSLRLSRPLSLDQSLSLSPYDSLSSQFSLSFFLVCGFRGPPGAHQLTRSSPRPPCPSSPGAL